jgi:hypothetical protein
MQVGEKSTSAVDIHAQMWAGLRQTNRRTRNETNLTLTLTPRSDDSRLDILVISKFPFLVSNATFSRYKREHGEELNNLSPLHASISQKGGVAYIEDLGSTHGTFVDGVRVREHAVPLQDGVVVAFGGKHFMYEVSITRHTGTEPAKDGASPVEQQEASQPQAYDKTMFMAAPSTFLQVFCDPGEPKRQIAAPSTAIVPVPPSRQVAVARRQLGGIRLLLAELTALDDGDGARRKWWIAAAVAGVLLVLGVTVFFWSSTERDLKNAMARGDYARATVLASQLLDKHPEDGELESLATDAALKANVPSWLKKVRARDFDAAQGVLAGMSEVVKRDADLTPMIGELRWLGDLESSISRRGGPAAPIRIYADEDSVAQLIGRWNEDTGEHQRALDRIASHVPQFGDWYAEALAHLRRLQSESTVYLPVIERLKANITTELGRDNAEALEPTLKDAEQKYPGLGGLAAVRQDLKRYIEIRQEARSRKTGRLFALVRTAHFVTAPFKQSLGELTESGQLPPKELLQQYEAATQAWKAGKSEDGFAGLQKLATGPWGEDAAKELERRRAVAVGFAALHAARGSSDFVDQLLAFRTSLDSEEDVYFVHATAADLTQQKDTLAARARDNMNRASGLWQEYRSGGAIDASQRVESAISEQFRTRARLLAEADRNVQQGYQIYSQIDSARAAQWIPLREEIQSEALQQRSRLQDLSRVVEPELLRTKLALLGDSDK